ncbi:hypothetical protein L1Z46_19495, partial [Acinetobacter baumannii]|nr:hypothetical protein [Acinetobacter baumannii]
AKTGLNRLDTSCFKQLLITNQYTEAGMSNKKDTPDGATHFFTSLGGQTRFFKIESGNLMCWYEELGAWKHPAASNWLMKNIKVIP